MHTSVIPFCPIVFLLSLMALSGASCQHIQHAADSSEISALANVMRQHPYYAEDEKRGAAFVFLRSGHKGSWRYSIEVPSEFVMPLISAGKSISSTWEPEGNAFDRYVGQIIRLLSHGEIIWQRPIKVDGFDFMSIRVIWRRGPSITGENQETKSPFGPFQGQTEKVDSVVEPLSNE